jgi:hypothetical protein
MELREESPLDPLMGGPDGRAESTGTRQRLRPKIVIAAWACILSTRSKEDNVVTCPIEAPCSNTSPLRSSPRRAASSRPR